MDQVKNEFFCQHIGGDYWEEVDEFVYANSDKVILSDGTPRYGNKKVAKTEQGLSVSGVFSSKDLAIVCRILGVDGREANVGVNPIGWTRKPEFVRISMKGKQMLHEFATGINFSAKVA